MECVSIIWLIAFSIFLYHCGGFRRKRFNKDDVINFAILVAVLSAEYVLNNKPKDDYDKEISEVINQFITEHQ